MTHGVDIDVLAQISMSDNDTRLRQIVDRAIVLHPASTASYHSSIRYGSRKDLLHMATVLDSLQRRSNLDRSDWGVLIRSIPERHLMTEYTPISNDSLSEKQGWLKTFYKGPHTFLKIDVPDFFLVVHPVIHMGLGTLEENGQRAFQNTRGVKIRGLIDQKLYFYSSLFETQRRYPQYLETEIMRLNAIPGQGFFKPYRSSIFGGISGHDFLNGQAYFGLKISRSIDLQVGHGRNFIGEGIRSLLLSDFGHNYFYLRLSTQVWKLNYQSIFAELAATSSRDNIGDILLPKKYMAAHYLNFNISPRLSIGLFESVIFGRDNGFELQYLNPVILFRAVEQMLDSPDNVLLGLNARWTPLPQWQLYGQLIIDELKTSQAFNGSGWWGNKIAYQIGSKYYNAFGIDHLDLQAEHNTARPYTYAHRSFGSEVSPLGSYTHFNQSLAHPYGANFRETIIELRYRPLKRLFVSLRYLRSYYGEDEGDINLGRDIRRDYSTRLQDFNNYTGQGSRQDINLWHGLASYEIFPNGYVDLNFLFRHQRHGDINNNDSKFLGVGFRMNVSSEDLDF